MSVTVCSIAPKRWTVRRQWAVYVLATASPTKPFLLTVEDAWQEGRKVTAEAIADDIVNEITNTKHRTPEACIGVFVCAGKKPTKKELEEAERKQAAYGSV